MQAWDYRYTGEGDALVQDDLTTAERGEAYAYDGMHRLIDNKRGPVAGNTVSAPTFLQGWTLDKVGNWTIWNDNGAGETRTHNNHHALTSRSTVPFPQVYDANFNQTDDGSAFTFVYDANDQLQQVKDRGTGVVLARYSYDAFGRRVEKSVPMAPRGARVTRYYYSDQRIIEERNERDTVQAIYTYGTYIDEPLTMDRGGERFYYHSNKQFSTYALTDSSGQIVERYSYTPYGQATTFDAAYQDAGFTSRVGNPFTFTGRELDAETDLMHFRARTYDTVQGRFKQRDPIGYVDGMNLYAGYFASNFIDPFGLFKCSTVVIVGHKDTARKAAWGGSGELSKPGTCSRAYPVGCLNEDLYLPKGANANYGSQKNTGMTEFGTFPRDYEELDSFIGKGLFNIGKKNYEKFKTAMASLEQSVERKRSSGNCCDCENYCFYIIFVTTKEEREKANKPHSRMGDPAKAGYQMGYAANSNLDQDKDDPVVEQVRNTVGGPTGNNQNDLFTTVYKRCWPCK